MAISQITNIGLQCGEFTFPIIKVVLDSPNAYTLTDDDITAIANLSAGCVSVCTPYPRTGLTITQGTYGDTDNFYVRIVSSAEVRLYYKNNVLCRAYNYTGYEAFTGVFILLFVDENNNVFSQGSTAGGGLYLGYDVNPGFSQPISGTVVAPVGAYKRIVFYSKPKLSPINVNVTDFIINEIDPGITDPYNPGGESDTSGGTGDFDGTSDNIDFPSLPTLSAADTGFITLFNPSLAELKNLANYMWSNSLFDLASWKKIFADPIDAILGLSIVPVAVPNGGTSAVTVGNISTEVDMNKAASQYVEVDCGTLNVNEFWGAYLDYSPYTKAEIYLPYVGTHPIDVDDIMNKAVHVKYHVDVLSGACCAYVKCGGSVMYSFAGQCSCSIPITGNDWTNVVNGALTIAASIGSMVASGGASAPMAASTIASTAINSMKPNVEKSGSMGGMGGMLGVQTPYIILTRPRQALPKNQNKFIGYPSFITRKLSDVSGYTEIESIHIDGVPATEQELSELESLLKGGVIL